jgi:protein disulfide-isomerase
MAFVQMDWPDDADVSAEATAWRQFADKFKIGSSPIQLIFWDFGLDKVQARVTGFDSQQTDSLIEQLSRQLPHPDYTGEWLTDFRTAQAIAAVQKKPVFIFFTSMDSSEYCQAFESEIIKTDEFTAYSRKYLVLVKVDFPQHSQLSDALKDQNRRLADLYGIRGYPTIILLNSDGHRIGDAKYQKGGPVPFLTELGSVVKMDKQRRTPTP